MIDGFDVVGGEGAMTLTRCGAVSVAELLRYAQGRESGEVLALTTKMAHSEDLVQQIAETCSFIAPVTAYPGEFEMEAMGAAVARVLSGQEALRKYAGRPVWTGFDFESETAR